VSSTPYTVGDTEPVLTGSVSADLTAATIRVNVARPDGTVFSRAGDVVLPTIDSSTWSFQLDDGDLTVPGLYRLEVEVHYAGGGIQTFAFDATGRANTFSVRDQLA